jgi:DNA-binding transcriptional LysR family regulator
MTMTLELRHLRHFVAVAETRSFSAAAARLYVSQQAVSRVIQQLERELGVRLLDRTTRSVELTDAGRSLLSSAKRSIATTEAAFEEVRQLGRDNPTRPLRLDLASTGLETPALILQQMRLRHPELPIHLVEDGLPRGLNALLEGRLDALLGLANDCPPDVTVEPLHHEPILLGMASTHPLAGLDVVPVARLADVDLLLPSDVAAVEWVDHVRAFCAQAGVTPRRWPVATHGSAAATAVLRDAACVTPTVAWVDPPDDLVFRPLVEPRPLLPWSLMISPTAQGRPEVDWLVQGARSIQAQAPRDSATRRIQ